MIDGGEHRMIDTLTIHFDYILIGLIIVVGLGFAIRAVRKK